MDGDTRRMPTKRALSQLDALSRRMARLLLLLESEAHGDARPCPFCIAPEDTALDGADMAMRLAHAKDCELELTLRAAGLRR